MNKTWVLHRKFGYKSGSKACRRYYHPPTKLWEGNVFSPVCLSFSQQGRQSHVNTACDVIDQSQVTCYMGNPPQPQPLLPGHVQTWTSLYQDTPRLAVERAVGLRPKGFLLLHYVCVNTDYIKKFGNVSCCIKEQYPRKKRPKKHLYFCSR